MQFRPSELGAAAEAAASAPPGRAPVTADGGGFADALLWAEGARSSSPDARGDGDPGRDLRSTETDQAGDDPGTEISCLPPGTARDVLELCSPDGRLAPQAARQLARYLWDAHRRGCRALELKLRPEGLGRLALRIEVRGREVRVAAVAEKPEVVQLLFASRHELAAGLARWGLVLSTLEAHSEASQPKPNQSSRKDAPDDQRARGVPHLPTDNPRRSFFEVVA